MRAFETADQAAGSSAAMLADGERLSRLWREAWPWWFVTDLRGLHPRALVESPSSFRRRGVFDAVFIRPTWSARPLSRSRSGKDSRATG
jgi:hypothetical protein